MTQPEEFDCCECGNHIVIIAGPMPDPRLCAACMMLPGWHEDPRLAELIDPGRGMPDAD